MTWQGTQVEENCYGTQFYSAIQNITWSSSNPGVETVDSYGYAQAVGVGDATIYAAWNRVWYLYGGPDDPGTTCEPINYPQNSPVPVEVRPVITSITPNSGSIGTTVNVTIVGTGFRSGATVNAGSGISVSNVAVVSSTQITANFVVAANATGGNRSATVTVGGRPSNAVNFYVQIPTKARRDEFPAIVIREPNPGDFVNVFGDTVRTNVCGAYRNVKYTLLDQAANPILQQVTVNEILTDFMPSDPNITPPAAEPGQTVEDEGTFGDLVGVAYASPCNIPPFSFTINKRLASVSDKLPII